MRGGGFDTGSVGLSALALEQSLPRLWFLRYPVWGRKMCCRLVALSGNNNSKPESGPVTFTRPAGLSPWRNDMQEVTEEEFKEGWSSGANSNSKFFLH